MIKTILIDQRNKHLITEIVGEVQNCRLGGFDIETEDSRRHEGLNQLMKVSEEGVKGSASKLYFDIKRTTITGFSLYLGGDAAYYFNLAHSDVENRLNYQDVKPLFDAKGDNMWVCHNAPFELTMVRACWGLRLTGIVDSMQLAVTVYNSDTYDKKVFQSARLGVLKPLIPEIQKVFYGLFSVKDPLNFDQEKLLAKVCAKTGHSEASYNGFVRTMAYGFGLKQAVERHFNHQMTTFEDLLANHTWTLGRSVVRTGKKQPDIAHIGQLTGEQVANYGAEDSYWAVELFKKLWQQCTPLMKDTFLAQENPMIYVFSDCWYEGMKLNSKAVFDRRALERHNVSNYLREMKGILAPLTWQAEPHKLLAKYEPWYVKNRGKYQRLIDSWVASPDGDDLTVCTQVKTATGNAWIAPAKPTADLSINHYMAMRTILFDLCQLPLVVEMGKVQSDAEARKNMGDHPILAAYQKLAGAEQRMKLYLTPYLQMVDPDTNKVHPIMSSRLDTRRTAAQNPKHYWALAA